MGVFQKNRAFFLFLAKFAISYLILSGLYWLYLSQYDADLLQTDGMTHSVAKQSGWLIRWFGEGAFIEPHESQACYRLYVNNQRVARIVEGCNAVSVMILFAAFIVAFSTTFKRTLLYILAGLIIIHVLNILRIALLGLGIFYYRDYAPFLHDVVFPLFIYGVVFVLWVAWVIKFSGNAKTTSA